MEKDRILNPLSLQRLRIPAFVLGGLSLLSVVATYIIITHISTSEEENRGLMTLLAAANILLLGGLLALVLRQMLRLWQGFRRDRSGTRLQKRILMVFSLGALVPGVMVSLMAGYLFYFGIQSWFDSKTSTVLDESVAVASAYMQEHQQVIRGDLLAMANDINHQSSALMQNPELFNKFVAGQALVRSLMEAVVFQEDRVIARSQLSFSFAFERLPMDVMRRVDNGEAVVMSGEHDDRVRAITKLDNLPGMYLLVGRFVDPKVVAHLDNTRGAVAEYRALEENINHLQWTFFSVFLLISLLLLFGALWYGLVFASKLLEPVSQLYTAAEKVREGDLSVQVPEQKGEDELAVLGRAFNRMTRQLSTQRVELIAAQRRSAWADVARRIAHEIKNPLTPIQLATERLQRKYGKALEGEDQENFAKYIGMIQRHVADIGRMVEEFSSFARMPAPQFADFDLAALVREVVFSEECRRTQIPITTHLPEGEVTLRGDAAQLGRAIGNLLKNALEVLETQAQPMITVTLTPSPSVTLTIEDNGAGFPEALLPHLTEPYVTTRQKGTGLGLAIVKKIIEDHHGTLTLENRPQGGARVVIDLGRA
jgi:two-component system nitrogen regulation sensor histidine kinase NtrY